VLSVADGTVVSVLNNLEDQPPGQLPDVSTVNLATVTGNHVILDLGSGVYAVYAHLQKNSVVVEVGQHVKRGQLLGKLGNSGNTSAPHLHFHLVDSPSVLGSNGIPYVIDNFAFTGRIPADNDEAGPNDLQKSWSSALFPDASQHHQELPLGLDIVDFPEAPAHEAAK
jgi:murein DD-endopeptidase MepM/ murein hydrolase activator NlpD